MSAAPKRRGLNSPDSPAAPDTDGGRKIVMARLGAPHGVRGWLRLRAHTSDPAALADNQCWAAKAGGEWQPATITDICKHSGAWLVKLRDIDDRDAAIEWRGGSVAVLRSSLPQLPDGGFYWCDLLGLRAHKPDGEEIGVVSDLIDAGSTVLVITKTGGGELLAPFIDEYVPAVDVGGGKVTVDIPDAV